MASANDYAQWIVDNKDRAGTPEFEKVVSAYQLSRQQPEQPQKEEYKYLPNMLFGAIEPNLALMSGAVAGPVSGIAGIAGSLLPGPEGQGADWVRRVQQGMTYSPASEAGRAATDLISYPFRKLGEAAQYAGGAVTDATGSPLAGTVVDTAIQSAPLLASRLIPATPSAETIQGTVARNLLQKAVKPTSRDLRTGHAQRALQTMLDESIPPTPSGMEKASRIVANLNSEVDQAIANSNARVSIPRVVARTQDVADAALRQVNPTHDVASVTNAVTEFANHPTINRRITIPVQTAQELKQGTYRALGGKSYGELGSASTEAQKALARGLREEVIANVPEIASPLAREASLMNLLDTMANRVDISRNRNIQGLSALRSDSPIAWSSFMLDRSTPFMAWLARRIYDTANPNAMRTAIGSSAVNTGSPSLAELLMQQSQ